MTRLSLILGLLLSLPATAYAQPRRVADAVPTLVMTNAYDAFGAVRPGMTQDFGFSTVLRYKGKTILFDAGTDSDLFERNL
ncbi:MAG: hypothetical protein ABIO61_07065 [Thermomonas sp.]